MQKIVFSCVDVNVAIACDSDDVFQLLCDNFAAMSGNFNQPELVYRVGSGSQNGTYTVDRNNGKWRASGLSPGQLYYELESDLVVQLQLLRPDLLFMHSAAVALDGQAHLFLGRSGDGKSTTCWGLLNKGFAYLSDELAPVDLASSYVHPYSHALCMKAAPPKSFPVPETTLVTDRGLHVPVAEMPGGVLGCPMPLRSLWFVKYSPDNSVPDVAGVGHAEAATRLYPNILNALAHDNDGLAAARKLTGGLACYRLNCAELGATAELVANTISRGL